MTKFENGPQLERNSKANFTEKLVTTALSAELCQKLYTLDFTLSSFRPKQKMEGADELSCI